MAQAGIRCELDRVPALKGIEEFGSIAFVRSMRPQELAGQGDGDSLVW